MKSKDEEISQLKTKTVARIDLNRIEKEIKQNETLNNLNLFSSRWAEKSANDLLQENDWNRRWKHQFSERRYAVEAEMAASKSKPLL